MKNTWETWRNAVAYSMFHKAKGSWLPGHTPNDSYMNTSGWGMSMEVTTRKPEPLVLWNAPLICWGKYSGVWSQGQWQINDHNIINFMTLSSNQVHRNTQTVFLFTFVVWCCHNWLISALIVTSNLHVMKLQEEEIDWILNALRSTLNSSNQPSVLFCAKCQALADICSPKHYILINE